MFAETISDGASEGFRAASVTASRCQLSQQGLPVLNRRPIGHIPNTTPSIPITFTFTPTMPHFHIPHPTLCLLSRLVVLEALGLLEIWRMGKSLDVSLSSVVEVRFGGGARMEYGFGR